MPARRLGRRDPLEAELGQPLQRRVRGRERLAHESTEATRTSSTSGWTSSRRIISAPAVAGAADDGGPVALARCHAPPLYRDRRQAASGPRGRRGPGQPAARPRSPPWVRGSSDALGWLAGQRPAMEALLERLVASRTRSPATGRGRGRREPGGGPAPGARLRRGAPRLAALRPPPALLRDGGRRAGLPGRPHRHRLPPRARSRASGARATAAVGPGAFDMKGGIVGDAVRAGRGEASAAPGAGAAARDPGRRRGGGLARVAGPDPRPTPPARTARWASSPGVRETCSSPGARESARVQAEARGVAAHAGNEHEKGRSAIWSLARFIDRAQALTDPERGVTVNVGSSPAAPPRTPSRPQAQCEVDLRFERTEDGHALVRGPRGHRRRGGHPGHPRSRSFSGSWRDPLERTPASSALAKDLRGLPAGERPGHGRGAAGRRRLRRLHHRGPWASPPSTASARAGRRSTPPARRWTSRPWSPRRWRCSGSWGRGRGRSFARRILVGAFVSPALNVPGSHRTLPA